MQYFKDIIHRYKVSLLIITSFIVVVLIGSIAYSLQMMNRVELVSDEKSLSALEILQQLKTSSNPVTVTEKERIDTLNVLKTQSAKVTLTKEERIKILEELSKK